MCWARGPAWCRVVGLILSCGRIFFLLKGIFPLELTWVLTPFPQNSFGWEYKPKSSLHTCIPSHGLKRSWHLCSRRVNAGNKNTSSMHHPWRQNVTTSMVGLKKKSLMQKISPKMVNPRDLAGNTEEEVAKAFVVVSYVTELCAKASENISVQTDHFDIYWSFGPLLFWYQ